MIRHLAIPHQAEHIILITLAIAIVLCVCTCLWLIKQIMQVEMKTRAINQEIEKRSHQ